MRVVPISKGQVNIPTIVITAPAPAAPFMALRPLSRRLPIENFYLQKGSASQDLARQHQIASMQEKQMEKGASSREASHVSITST